MKMSEKPLIKRPKKRPAPTGQLGFHPRQAAAPAPSTDTVPAMLSPGEYVLSQQDMQHPLVQALVHHLSGMGGAPAGGPGPIKQFATGGAVADNSYSPWMQGLGQGGNYGNLGQYYATGASPSGNPAAAATSQQGAYVPQYTATGQMNTVTSQNGTGAYNPTGDPRVMQMLESNGQNQVYQQNAGTVNQLQSLGMDDPMARAGMLASGRRAGMQSLVSTVGNAQAGAAQSAQDFIRQSLSGQYGQEQANTRQNQQLEQQQNQYNTTMSWQQKQWQQQLDEQKRQRDFSLWGQLGGALVSGGIAGAGAGVVSSIKNG